MLTLVHLTRARLNVTVFAVQRSCPSTQLEGKWKSTQPLPSPGSRKRKIRHWTDPRRCSTRTRLKSLTTQSRIFHWIENGILGCRKSVRVFTPPACVSWRYCKRTRNKVLAAEPTSKRRRREENGKGALKYRGISRGFAARFWRPPP